MASWLEGDAGDILRKRAVIEERDQLLKAAANFIPGDSAREKAGRLYERIARYRAGRWQSRDRILKDCPYAPGSLDAVLWRLLKVKDNLPSEELIRKLIG